MGKTATNHGGPNDPEEIAAGMGGMSDDEYNMFESGFKDGRKGRSAKYEAPTSYDRVSQPEFPTSGEMAREFAEVHGYDASGNSSGSDAPAPDAEETSPTGDYIMNSLYGDSPSKPSDSKERAR
jgi:hypothetical protein